MKREINCSDCASQWDESLRAANASGEQGEVGTLSQRNGELLFGCKCDGCGKVLDKGATAIATSIRRSEETYEPWESAYFAGPPDIPSPRVRRAFVEFVPPMPTEDSVTGVRGLSYAIEKLIVPNMLAVVEEFSEATREFVCYCENPYPEGSDEADEWSGGRCGWHERLAESCRVLDALGYQHVGNCAECETPIFDGLSPDGWTQDRDGFVQCAKHPHEPCLHDDADQISDGVCMICDGIVAPAAAAAGAGTVDCNCEDD